MSAPIEEARAPVRYGFVIDQRKCIGCHACTVACKEENQIPLGVFRTWVKYVERGTFPNTRRYFAVLRCNHCDDAPCVTICPTVALYRRPDGIVDLDGARCIGCKSCMQACPYDALHIDPATSTAAKCHYCAHRIEVGLEPACVVVCPEQAIVAGDLDDPTSPVARLVATEQVQVRKPEQGTRPKVYYVGADTSALTPSLQEPVERYLWAERTAEELSLVTMTAALQRAEPHGDGALARPTYDVPHMPRPWGWRVSTYLWTKSIAAGLPLAAVFADGGPFRSLAAPVLSLVFLALTTALLIADLKRPDRFHYILLKPNWRSWLVWGAWILIAFGAFGSAGLVALLAGTNPPDWLSAIWVLLGLATAGYSALLFGQAEGRDFWQSPLKAVHLVVVAIAAGSATLLTSPLLAIALVAHGVLVMIEVFGRHSGWDVTLAARLLTRGPLRLHLWGGVIAAGVVVPIAAAVAAGAWESVPLAVVAAVLALGGLWLWEDLWVRAGQSIPLS